MREREFQNNAVTKKMIVVERDPKKMRVRGRVIDEDETMTYWLDVLASSSSATKSFNMSDIGDEVWASLDPKGEEGFIHGSRYNNEDQPPDDNNDIWSFTGPWGSVRLNKATGELTVNLDKAAFNIREIVLNGESLTHNGRNIGSSHTHGGVDPGGANTTEPNA